MPKHNPNHFLVYSYPDHSGSPVLLTHPLTSREEFFSELASALRQPKQVKRPAPKNLDAMADLLKEAKVKKVICSAWQLNEADDRAIRAVFKDLGIVLVR
ncbi:hypothetical protein C3B44_03180 [Corynebacterium yudongzhengii]|uniref:Uncharacterized protein n=1 Tax=Corynebacterium yudongzhengii TaxID=2080740 RepID=A0A2U1T7H5_9CORY|nr:hypothetical protein [Corynebacterium yudongzhengii]AWB81480.1 hypothetical protein C3B44_03180 [Corynebacterium yudongzhengii]PWC01949.1 hypothetical protein DF222_05065 [Corynebacterium yudongzhengii]